MFLYMNTYECTKRNNQSAKLICMPKHIHTLQTLHANSLLHINGFSVTYARKPIFSLSMSELYFNYHKYFTINHFPSNLFFH